MRLRMWSRTLSEGSLCENSGCVSFRGAEEPALSGAEGRRGISQVTCFQGEIPRGVYPEPPHFVRGRSQAEGERARNETPPGRVSIGLVWSNLFEEIAATGVQWRVIVVYSPGVPKKGFCR